MQDKQTAEQLAQFHTVFLGGGPAWPQLIQQARAFKIRLAPTYGMTETAAQVATLKPENFLAGQFSCGQPLPHAQIVILEEARGGSLPAAQQNLTGQKTPAPCPKNWTDCD